MSGPRAFAYDGGAFPTTARVTGLSLGPHLFELWLTGGVLSLRVDSRAPVTVSGVGSLAGSSVVIMGSGHLGATFFAGRVAALLTCNVALEGAEQDAARKYLASKYGVPA